MREGIKENQLDSIKNAVKAEQLVDELIDVIHEEWHWFSRISDGYYKKVRKAMIRKVIDMEVLR